VPNAVEPRITPRISDHHFLVSEAKQNWDPQLHSIQQNPENSEQRTMAPRPTSIYGQVTRSIEGLPLYYIIPSLFITLFLGFIVKRRYLSPLRRFPGPFWGSVTRWWLVRSIFRGDHEKTMRRLHAKYGPIVRITPFEVAISDPDAIKTIYGHTSGFTKVISLWKYDLTIRVNGTRRGIIKLLATPHCFPSWMKRSMLFDAETLPMRIV